MFDSQSLTGIVVESTQGELLGRVEATYVEDITGEPTWAAVSDGKRTRLVALDAARYDGAVLRLPVDTDELRTAPAAGSPAPERADKRLVSRLESHTEPA